jgi:hypothetical protein
MSNRRISLSQLLGAVPPPAKQTGIQFCNRKFSEPTLHRTATPLSWPGLYAILVLDSRCSPRPYRVIYFGQGGNLAERVTASHEKYEKWCRAASGSGNLYVAFYWMPTSTERRRMDAESELIRTYNPECNIASNPWGGTFGFK